MLENIKLSNTVSKKKNFIKKKFSLVKIENFTIIESPKITINQNNDLINIRNFHVKFNEYIDTFIKTIQEKNPNVSLEIFFENLKTLIIEEKNSFNNFIFFKSSTVGKYQKSNNKILVLKNNYLKSIYHELLHCASRKKVGNKILVGFNQNDIGIGLNEGYTSILEERYFNNSNGYIFENLISHYVELIVGVEKMTKLYFAADLYNLVEEMKKYSNEENIILFIKYLDMVCLDSWGIKKLKEGDEKINYIGSFLCKCYSKKLLIAYKDKIISYSNAKLFFQTFLYGLNNIYNVGKKSYVIISDENKNKILEEFYNKLNAIELDNDIKENNHIK